MGTSDSEWSQTLKSSWQPISSITILNSSEFASWSSIIGYSNAEKFDPDGETNLPLVTSGVLLPLIVLLGVLLIKKHQNCNSICDKPSK